MEQHILDRPIPVYAGFWIRVGAYLIDIIITGAVSSIISRVFFGDYFSSKDYPDPGPGAISLLVSWLYFALQESSERQATIGKMATGIKVCGEQGERISFANATGRYFAKILSAVILFIGFIMVAFNDRKQGLHDKLAKTYVVGA